MSGSKLNKLLLILLLSHLVLPLFTASAVFAGDVDIVDVKLEKQRANWVFHVTLKHADTGWEHYADAWRVVTQSGDVLGTRTLHHPHVNEQPFTRSLGNVAIPANTKMVFIEAHDKVHGWSKKKYKVKIQ